MIWFFLELYYIIIETLEGSDVETLLTIEPT